MGLSETVWEMQEEINQLRADRDKWKRLYETVVVKDEGMQLYEEIDRLRSLLEEVARVANLRHGRKK